MEGNTHGLGQRPRRALERLARRRIPAERLLTQELAREITALAHETRRTVGLLLDRRGAVTHIMCGDARGITMPDWGRMRAGSSRLRGLRCLRTCFAPGGGGGLSREDLSDLAALRFDAISAVEVGADGLPGLVHTAALTPAQEAGAGIQKLQPLPPSQLTLDFQQWIRALEEELARNQSARETAGAERALLVLLTGLRGLDLDAEAQEQELRQLAAAAGVQVAGAVTQRRPKPDPKTAVGGGKLQELALRTFQHNVDLVIFDADLNATQARNLAEKLDLRVIDRTQLILDIFAQRATTRDGKLQVELAQLKYALPRLAQRDTSLSRLAGGIGSRGPGESKLELDRRRVRARINKLEKQLRQLEGQRKQRRARRNARRVPVLSIVGYTNAGKSTLLQALTKSAVPTGAHMFATLDTASRRLRFPRDREVIITDTVGFIRDLPPDLVAAFRATLEELHEADLFLHVVDAADADAPRKISAVRRVLADLQARETPELLVFNQIDRLPPGEGAARAAECGALPVSALHQTGLTELLRRAETTLENIRA